MARLFHAGAEVDVLTGSGTNPDGLGGIALVRDTTVFRSGLASWKFDSGAGNLARIASLLVTFVDGRSYFLRGYFRAAAAPGTACQILYFDSSTKIGARFRTDGAVELMVGSAAQGSPSGSIADSSWHRIELKGTVTATQTWTAAELLVDGVSVATWSGSIAISNSQIVWGWLQVPGASKVLNADDLALNDSAGSVNNSYPGAGAVVLLAPTADSAIGTGWTGGGGGASSLFAAVDNTPPVGVVDPGTNTSQIRNATSNANSNYDATMTTYTAAGVGASDTVNAVIPWVSTAAPVVTSAKLGTVGVVSNPAITNVNLAAGGTAGAFWSGVAGGTYATGWKWTAGTLTETPSVTVGTAPVMRITQVTASTRIAVVCFMGIYVDYTPAAVAAAPIPDVNMALTVT